MPLSELGRTFHVDRILIGELDGEKASRL